MGIFSLFLAGGVFAGLKGTSIKAASASAEISSDVIDVTGKTTWKASEGTMVSVPNWANSGLGFSVELHAPILATGAENGMVFNLSAEGEKVTNTNMYMINRAKAGNVLVDRTASNLHNLKYEIGPGRMEVVDKATSWVRYELMFADVPGVIASTATKTLDEIRFIWYGTIVTEMRNLRVIDAYRSSIGDTEVGYNETYNAGLLQNKAGMQVREIPLIPGLASATGGFSFEFKPSLQKNSLIYLCDKDWAAINTGNLYYYKKNISEVSNLRELDDGWYRYEAMFSSFTAIAGKENTEIAVIKLYNSWGADYNCEPSYRNFKLISAFTGDSEVAAAQWATGFVSATAGVCDASGNSNVAAVTAVMEEYTTKYQNLSATAKMFTIHPDLMAASLDAAMVKTAIERYGYIANKYGLTNGTNVDIPTARNINFLAMDANKNYLFAILGISALALATGAIVLKRRKAAK